MKILVTGGSGYLGIHVRRFFDAENFSRRCNLDILSEVDLSRLALYDAVIHLGAHLDKDPAAAELCFRTNAEATASVEQMEASGTLDTAGKHVLAAVLKRYADTVAAAHAVEPAKQV